MKPLSRENTREFIKLFDKLAYNRGYSDIWPDFVLITACTISNLVDMEQYNHRLERLQIAAKRYNKDEKKLLLELLSIAQDELFRNPDQDYLGNVYEGLGLCKKSTAQFFTPYHISKFMALACIGNAEEEIKQKGFLSINDPCCGAGAMLVAAANVCREQGVDIGRDVLFVAQDIDPEVAMMCYIQLALLGCAGYILVGNSLSMEPISPENKWYLPMMYQQVWVDRGFMEISETK